jgi:hypothetical protein
MMKSNTQTAEGQGLGWNVGNLAGRLSALAT